MSNQSQCVKKIPFQTNLFSPFLPSRPVLFCLYYHQASASRLGTSKKNSTNTLPITHTHTSLPTTTLPHPAVLTSRPVPSSSFLAHLASASHTSEPLLVLFHSPSRFPALHHGPSLSFCSALSRNLFFGSTLRSGSPLCLEPDSRPLRPRSSLFFL
ncbi:hypothetical protein K456DRAFT_1608649 [Colletotrichum gloeosporioides 23]|nr:hypothetical protein K456DRAFT_1608649 [Colletotrichum gloeosporioides 23]